MEVNYDGEWGTVCDDGWDDTDAGVVCRQLGFGSSGTAIGSAGFGQGSGTILLSNVSCDGDESILARCGHLGINVTRSCTHVKDAGLKCSGLQGMDGKCFWLDLEILENEYKLYTLTAVASYFDFVQAGLEGVE